MSIRFLFSLIVVFFISVSCVGIYRFSIETLEPAKILLSDSIRVVDIINNIASDKKDSSKVYYYENDSKLDSISEKKLAVKFLADELNSRFMDSLRFRVNLVSKGSLVDNTGDSIKNLARMQNYCKQNKVDGLILLNDLNYSYRSNLRDTYLFGELLSYYAEWSYRFDADILLYNMHTNSYENVYTTSDTVMQSSYFVEEANALAFFPDDLDVIKDIAFRVGTDYALHVSPAWMPCDRHIYTGKSKLRNADVMVKNGDWESARQIWQPLAEQKSNRLGAVSAYNMAVYYEIEGSLPDALYWAELSYKKQALPATLKYIKELRLRQEKEQQLILQLDNN